MTTALEQHLAELRSHLEQYQQFQENDPRTRDFYYGTAETISRNVHALKSDLNHDQWSEVHESWMCYADMPPEAFEPNAADDRGTPIEAILSSSLGEIINAATRPVGD